MSEANSPEYARGREHHEERNAYRGGCPPVDVWTYAPQDLAYPVMYERGWNSVEDAPMHSCKVCRRETGADGP